MMNDGDLSPMLSQPADDDNTPMISGRGTKIIADARGAYLAGNLYALVEWMYAEQRLRLHQAIVRGAISHLRASLRSEDVSPHTPEFIEAAERWLTTPTSENSDAVLDLERTHIYDGSTGRFDPTEAILVFFSWSVMADTPEAAASYATTVATLSAILQYQGEFTQAVADELNARNRQQMGGWHQDMAWAILRGAAPPKLPELIISLAMVQDGG